MRWAMYFGLLINTVGRSYTMRWLKVFAALFCLVLIGFASADESEHPLRAEILADVDTIASGKPFYLGVRFRIDPDWHIYWQSPRDTGIATTVAWELPDGYRAGPLLWPVPERFEEEGDIVSYGYSKEVVLMTRVEPPAEASKVDTLEFGATATWLVCHEKCIPGDAKLSVKLKTSTTDARASRDAPMFETWRGRVPADTPSQLGIELKEEWTADAEMGLWALSFTLPTGMRMKPGSARAFPLSPGVGRIEEAPVIAVATSAAGAREPYRIDLPVKLGGADFQRKRLAVLITFEEMPTEPSAAEKAKTPARLRAFLVKTAAASPGTSKP
ncbi:MAG: protein-disulfide reductase DsbD domain-containing protein [Planctomycetota bacterium]